MDTLKKTRVGSSSNDHESQNGRNGHSGSRYFSKGRRSPSQIGSGNIIAGVSSNNNNIGNNDMGNNKESNNNGSNRKSGTIETGDLMNSTSNGSGKNIGNGKINVKIGNGNNGNNKNNIGNINANNKGNGVSVSRNINSNMNIGDNRGSNNRISSGIGSSSSSISKISGVNNNRNSNNASIGSKGNNDIVNVCNNRNNSDNNIGNSDINNNINNIYGDDITSDNKLTLEEILFETTPQAVRYNRTNYGLMGILNVIRMKDSDLNILALGTDLTTLGLNLNSSECLYLNFDSPWNTSKSNQTNPEYNEYIQAFANSPPAVTQMIGLKSSYVQKFSLETLFYIFYNMPQDLLQGFASVELCNRGWLYYPSSYLWYCKPQKDERKGEWHIFDVKKWKRIPVKDVPKGELLGIDDIRPSVEEGVRIHSKWIQEQNHIYQLVQQQMQQTSSGNNDNSSGSINDNVGVSNINNNCIEVNSGINNNNKNGDNNDSVNGTHLKISEKQKNNANITNHLGETTIGYNRNNNPHRIPHQTTMNQTVHSINNNINQRTSQRLNTDLQNK
ncbi:hypothetical protein FG379_001192 [Cryptosporidium bovis]|uniref:uncharacterized protein n=1 Tax=Cryptosporidium bovis TaxID=310047 RepID=UPI00351A1354|nr:hypothetical protein FG379_001192 [Cryptosporidium bovis]